MVPPLLFLVPNVTDLKDPLNFDVFLTVNGVKIRYRVVYHWMEFRLVKFVWEGENH